MRKLTRIYSIGAVADLGGAEACDELAAQFEQDYHARGKCLFSTNDNKVLGFVDEKKNTLELWSAGEMDVQSAANVLAKT